MSEAAEDLVVEENATDARRARLGVLLMLVGVLLLTFMDAAAKLLVEAEYSVIQILAVRAALIVLGLLLYELPRAGARALATERPGLHALRAVIGFFAPALFFHALGTMPLADTTVIFFAAPFMMTALALPLLKEKVALGRWILIATGFAGVVIASEPTPEAFHLGALLPFGAAFAYSIINVMGRMMRNTESVLKLVFYFNLGHALIGGVLLPLVWKPMSGKDFAVLVLMALLAVAGQLLLTAAFQLGPIGLIAPFEYSALVWTMIVGFVVFGDVPGPHVILGAVIITASGVYLGRRELRTAAGGAGGS